jgi:hypothetical protein
MNRATNADKQECPRFRFRRKPLADRFDSLFDHVGRFDFVAALVDHGDRQIALEIPDLPQVDEELTEQHAKPRLSKVVVRG